MSNLYILLFKLELNSIPFQIYKSITITESIEKNTNNNIKIIIYNNIILMKNRSMVLTNICFELFFIGLFSF